MTKHKYEHNQTSYPNPEISQVRAPYWARAHRDWRFLAVVFLMLVAIGVYVMAGTNFISTTGSFGTTKAR